MSSDENKTLELLLDRPLEPVFVARDNGTVVFDLPESFYTKRYQEFGVQLQTRFGADVEWKIPILDIPKPNINFAQIIGKRQHFSLFNNTHKHVAGELIRMFLEPEDRRSFGALAAFVKDRLNPVLFQYAFTVALQHRKDTGHIPLPRVVEQFPSNFVEPSVLQEGRAEGFLIADPGSRRRIEIPRNYTASDREEEQRLAYFREDIGVNMHHWHWHLVYPSSGPREIVAKNRRGELFYYMHHQIIARYNVERFCNNLARVKPLNDLRETISEAYFPKLIHSLSNRTYPARAANSKLRDINRENNAIEVADCERWNDRIIAAIDQGFVTDVNGQKYLLDEVHGIDLLGDIIEASILSVNPRFYGDLHNQGHNLLSLIHDPDERHLEGNGVMGDVTTAMRDPIFYRWHANIDNIFAKHKNSLPFYKRQQLDFDGISLRKASVKINSNLADKENILVTHWQKSDVDLAAALDFGPKGNVLASFTHLQNVPFTYTIEAINYSGNVRKGTCRIFICPKTDERGTALSLNEQRLMAIELDKFTVNLNPGENIIKQRSEDSSVTIPFSRTFRRIGPKYIPSEPKKSELFRFCGCGWPQHLLLPKGKPEGLKMDLFVMISDYNDDAVRGRNSHGSEVCGDAASYCGLKDALYPDKRTMGYPFDRRLPANNLDSLTRDFSNMTKTDVSIIFSDRVV